MPALLLLIPSSSVADGELFRVGYRATIRLSAPEATAAFSLDPSKAEASVEGGNVKVFGKAPGSTHVMVVNPSETRSFQVVVDEPPRVYPPGFVRPVDLGAPVAESGSYEFRYSSDPALVQNLGYFLHREGDRTVQFHLSGAARVGPATDHAAVSFPIGFYQINKGSSEFTFMDKIVTNSALTLNGPTIRGFHMRHGPWRFHMGYSSFAMFENLFLPSLREGVVGAGYRKALSANSSITPNLYYFPNEHSGARRGAVGSLLYEYRPQEELLMRAEIGLSRGMGVGGELGWNRQNERLRTTMRCQPQGFASLVINNLHGCFADVFWSKMGRKLTVDFTASTTRYRQTNLHQNNTVSNLGLTYQLQRRWSVHGGLGFAGFRSRVPFVAALESVHTPVGFNFHSAHFGGGMQYQYALNAGRDSGGHQYRTNLHGNWKGLHATAVVDRQTQAPTADHILTQIPALQQVLGRMGIAATTPQQLAELARQTAVLSALGYSTPLAINLTPVRLHYSGTIGWAGSHRYSPRIEVTSLYSRNESVNNSFRSAVHSASYMQKLSPSTDLFLSYSLLRGQFHGRELSYRPVMMVSLRRTLAHVPGLLIPERYGTVSGVVFQDDAGRRAYYAGAPPLAGVEVVLDGVRRTRTDQQGRFRFENVPYRDHQVEVVFSSQRPFFFTTPSRVDLATDETTHFGIGFALSRLIGYVKNDAGAGLQALEVRVVGGDRSYVLETDAEGRFSLGGLPAGEYEVSLNPDSVPPGYGLEALTPTIVKVDPAVPGRVTIVLRAYRNLAGRVRVFHRTSGSYVPLAGVVVRLVELGRQNTTDRNGAYIFRDLPSGEYSVVVLHEGKEFKANASLPDAPVYVKNLDIQVVVRDGDAGVAQIKSRPQVEAVQGLGNSDPR